MITKQVFHSHILGDSVFSHRNAARAREVVFAHGLTRARISHFVMTTDKQNRLTAHYALDSFPITIIDKCSNDHVILLDFDQPVTSNLSRKCLTGLTFT